MDNPDAESRRLELIDDIAARVRGYARFLAVKAITPYTLIGSYALPESAGPRQHKHLIASVSRDDGEHGDLCELQLSAVPQVGQQEPDGPGIAAASERSPSQIMIFNRYYDDPIITEETLSLNAAQRMMGWLRYFDTLMPDLVPEPSTAQDIDFYERLRDSFGEVRGQK